MDPMNLETSTSDSSDIVSDERETDIPVKTPKLPDNESPNKYVVDESGANNVPQNTNQPLNSSGGQKLPPFYVLKNAINKGKKQQITQSPSIVNAAVLTGQPLVYQPTSAERAQFIAYQEAMLYGTGVFLPNTQTYNPPIITPSPNINLVQIFPQNHQTTFNMEFNFVNNTNNEFQMPPTTPFDDGHNPLYSDLNPKQHPRTMQRKEAKIKLELDGRIPKDRIKQRYFDLHQRSNKTKRQSKECSASTSKDQINNSENKQYRFDDSSDSED